LTAAENAVLQDRILGEKKELACVTEELENARDAG
jgi:hypothetical protein